MSDSIADAVRALGVTFNPSVLAATRAIYAPFARQAPRDGVHVQLDLPYGPHPRHVADVYGNDLRGPTVLYLHGGGFNAGDKRSDDLFYSNIGWFFARAGIQTLLANYRLAPEVGWPAGIEDVRRVVDWARATLGVGTKARPLVLIGQSAGAGHASGYLFDPRTSLHAASHISGCVLMSGLYRASASQLPGVRAYFGESPQVDAERSPIGQVKATTVPLLLTVSELDPPEIAWHSFELAQFATRANGKSPQFRWFRGHNHVSTVHSLGSPQSDVAETLLDFIKATSGSAAATEKP